MRSLRNGNAYGSGFVAVIGICYGYFAGTRFECFVEGNCKFRLARNGIIRNRYPTCICGGRRCTVLALAGQFVCNGENAAFIRNVDIFAAQKFESGRGLLRGRSVGLFAPPPVETVAKSAANRK